MMAIARIRFFQNELGTYEFDLKASNELGEILLEETDIVSISTISRDSTVYMMKYIIGKTALRFGKYDFSISHGGQPLARTVLYAVQGPPTFQVKIPGV